VFDFDQELRSEQKERLTGYMGASGLSVQVSCHWSKYAEYSYGGAVIGRMMRYDSIEGL
jgi:hypothetical protein